jgi:transcriptional regulator with XRE-family HTH domain
MPSVPPSPFGRLLRRWRSLRGASQLALAVEAGTTPRHLSFLETGRSRPSREMVLRLAEALDVPLRERNALLAAAGFAARYHATDLDAPGMAPLRRVLAFLLRSQEPYPGVLLDRCGRVLDGNESALRLFANLAGPGAVWQERPLNVLRLSLDPDGVRPYLVNWEEAAHELLARLQREAAAAGPDDPLPALLDELLALPGLPKSWRAPDLDRPPSLVLALHFKRADLELRLFSTITTVGTPHDVTLEELRIESFLPADPASDAVLRSLAGAG